MEQHLPAPTDDATPELVEAEPPRRAYQQDISVAYLPLALITFLILAFGVAAWTVLAAG